MGCALRRARVLPGHHPGVKNTWPDHAFLIKIDLNSDETDQQPKQAYAEKSHDLESEKRECCHPEQDGRQQVNFSS
jgi:hypothetical protein